MRLVQNIYVIFACIASLFDYRKGCYLRHNIKIYDKLMSIKLDVRKSLRHNSIHQFYVAAVAQG